jgi:hypothetical protein
MWVADKKSIKNILAVSGLSGTVSKKLDGNPNSYCALGKFLGAKFWDVTLVKCLAYQHRDESCEIMSSGNL